MSRHTTDVADGGIGAVTSQVTYLAAVVAGLVIGAICSYVAWLVAVIAEPRVKGGYPGPRAITSKVTHLSASMAHGFIAAVTC